MSKVNPPTNCFICLKEKYSAIVKVKCECDSWNEVEKCETRLYFKVLFSSHKKPATKNSSSQNKHY